MSKNKMSDLRDHLFAQLERLNDDSLTPEQIEAEAKRSGAIVDLSDQLVTMSRVQLDAAKLYAAHKEMVLPFLPQIGSSPKSEKAGE